MRRAPLLLGVLALTFLVLGAPAEAATPYAKTGAASNIWSDTAVLNGYADGGGQPLTSCQFTYGNLPLPVGGHTVSCEYSPGSGGVYAVLTQLSPLTTYYYFLSVSNASGASMGSTLSFMTTSTSPPSPGATTDAATDVTTDSANLNGMVNPENVAIRRCQFQYGLTTSYGETAPCSPPPAASTTSNEPVSAALAGLSSGNTYHFRVEIITEGGTADGADRSFTAASTGSGEAPSGTSGTATTGRPTGITATSVKFHGSVNSQGQSGDSCAFYFGTGSGYQAEVPCSDASPTSMATQPEVAQAIALTPHTGYHYTIVLGTPAGPILGTPVTFKTLALPRASTRRATHVRRHTAILHGRVNAEGSRVIACYFQYARRSFKHGTPKSARSVGCRPHPGRSGWVSVHRKLVRLRHRTRYYFRVVLRTQAGKTIGATRSFRTRR